MDNNGGAAGPIGMRGSRGDYVRTGSSTPTTGPTRQPVVEHRAARVRGRLTVARMLRAAAMRLAPTTDIGQAEEPPLLQVLDRLAQLDAEMDRLRMRRPPGWGNTLAIYAAEADGLRRAMALEYKRDDRGCVFLVHEGSALYYLPSAMT